MTTCWTRRHGGAAPGAVEWVTGILVTRHFALGWGNPTPRDRGGYQPAGSCESRIGGSQETPPPGPLPEAERGSPLGELRGKAPLFQCNATTMISRGGLPLSASGRGAGGWGSPGSRRSGSRTNTRAEDPRLPGPVPRLGGEGPPRPIRAQGNRLAASPPGRGRLPPRREGCGGPTGEQTSGIQAERPERRDARLRRRPGDGRGAPDPAGRPAPRQVARGAHVAGLGACSAAPSSRSSPWRR